MAPKRIIVTGCAAFLLGLTHLADHATAQSLGNLQFNEGQGATTADQASGLVGTLGTTPDPIQRIRIVEDSPRGQAGDRSVDFNRAEHLVVEDTALAIRSGTYPGPFTVEAWFKSPATESPSVLGAYGTPGNGWSFGIYGGALTFTQVGVADHNSGLEVPVWDVWTHVACVYEPLPEGGAKVTFYVDGFPAELIVPAAMNAPQGNLLRIGAWLNGGFGPSGAIDRFRIHSAALSETELDSVATQPKAPLNSTVVAYNLNEPEPPFQSSVANRPNAIPSFSFFTDAPQWATDAPSGAAGDFSLSFNGTSRAVIADPGGLYQVEGSDLTLQAWVKPQISTGTQVILAYGPPGGYLLALTADNRIQYTALGVIDIVSEATVPRDGAWHHIAAVHRHGQQVLFYVDGSLRDTRPFTGSVGPSGSQQLFIGLFPGGILGYSGLLDRVRIDSAALSVENLDWRPLAGVDPDAPQLSIWRAALLTWPSTPPGYILQRTASLQQPVTWTNVQGTPVVEGNQYQLYVPIEEADMYYRLIKP
jgi:hypothetical protein